MSTPPTEPAPPPIIAAIVRRARAAKAAKERHDTAYFAWEASVRLAIAARPPADAAELAHASVGKWVAALALDADSRTAPALLALHGLFSEVGQGRRAAPRSVAPRKLLDGLPAYRNEVIGHGAPRATGFYDPAAETLLAGLEAAFAERVFPAVPAEPLRPWVLVQATEVGERTLFFNGRGRTAQYLDYLSGESLRGRALEAAFPGIHGELVALFREAQPGDGEGDAPDASLFGDYRLLAKLGEGGMGVVHLARQESLGRIVALKRLPPGTAADPVALARFRREVTALARSDHPNVVKVLASGEASGLPYYAMELVEGADLAAVAPLLSAGKGLAEAVSEVAGRLRALAPDVLAAPPAPAPQAAGGGAGIAARARELARVFRDAARGLHALHEVGIVHRDVKPANIMLTAGDLRAVVMDLGLAALSDSSGSLTRERGTIVGTLRYMAPEQIERDAKSVDRRADVYGLGATLYETLAGRPLFEASSEIQAIERALRAEPAPLERAAPGVPHDLALIVHRCLRKEPAARYSTAEALAADLDAFVQSRPIAARPPTMGYLFRLAVRRNPKVFWTATALGLALVATVAGAVVNTRRQQAAAEQRAQIARRALNAMVYDFHDLIGGDRSDLGRRLRIAVSRAARRGFDDLAAAEGTDDEVSVSSIRVYTALGGLDLESADSPETEAYALRAVSLGRRLAADRPGDFAAREALGLALAVSGLRAQARADLPAARRAYGEALEIFRDLAASPGANAEVATSLVSVLDRLGILEELEGRPSIAGLEDAVEVGRGSLARWPKDAPLATHVQRAILHLAARVEARDLTRTAALREEARRLDWAAGPTDYLSAMSSALSAGDTLLAAGDRAGAEEQVRRAVQLGREAIAANAEGRARRALAVSLRRLGDLLHDAGRLEEAREAYEESLVIRRRNWRETPSPGHKRDVAIALASFAAVSCALGDVGTAADAAEEAVRLDRERLATEAKSAWSQGDLLEGLGTLATVREAQLRPAEAAALLREAIAHAGGLTGSMPELERPLAKLRDRLRALEAKGGAERPPSTSRP